MSDLEENFGVIFDKEEYAGFIKRVVIAVVDLIFILVVLAAVLFISNNFISNKESFLNFNFVFFIFFSIWYLALVKRSKIRTIGYILTGVKIVNLKGEKPSIFKMILRASLLVLGPFELIVDIIWLTSEATKQTLRDKYVGTYVVNLNANPIGKGKLQNVTLGVMGWNLMYKEVKENLFDKATQQLR